MSLFRYAKASHIMWLKRHFRDTLWSERGLWSEYFNTAPRSHTALHPYPVPPEKHLMGTVQ